MGNPLKIGGLYKIKPKNIMEIDGRKLYLPVIGVLFEFSTIFTIEEKHVLIYLGATESFMDAGGGQKIKVNTPTFLFDNKKISMTDVDKPVDKQEYLYEEVFK